MWRTGMSSKFSFEFVDHPACVKPSLERFPAPRDRHRIRCFVGPLLVCEHEEILPLLLISVTPTAHALSRASQCSTRCLCIISLS
jgi:hypothetical protein